MRKGMVLGTMMLFVDCRFWPELRKGVNEAGVVVVGTCDQIAYLYQ